MDIEERFFIWAVMALFLTAMSISIFYRSRAESQQAQEARAPSSGPLLIAVRVTFLLGVFSAILIYTVKPEWTQWASMHLPVYVRVAGGVIASVAVLCLVWMFRHLANNVTPTAKTCEGHELVVSGPYRWVRHPMYSAAILFWLGMSLLAAKWFLLLIVGAGIVFVMVRTPREERNLVKHFGEAYSEYMARTGRYLPRFTV